MISEYDEVKKILDQNNVTDIEDIEYGGECFDDLMDYYSSQGEIPYGIMKARTGMPDEWIIDRVYDLGVLLDQDYYDANGLPLNFTDKYHDEEPA